MITAANVDSKTDGETWLFFDSRVQTKTNFDVPADC